jgi:hypothetical protein
LTLNDFRRRLGEGLAGQLLNDLSNEVIPGQTTGHVAVAKVLVSLIAQELATVWQGPVTAAEADDLTKQFGPSLNDALLAIESGDESRAAKSAEALARAYLSWVK